MLTTCLAFVLALAGGLAAASDSSTFAPEGRRLNNLVTLLLYLALAPAAESLPFVRPRDGWVFISLATHGEGTLRLTLDKGAPGETSINPAPGGGPMYEAMRYVTKGRHTLRVERAGTISLERLTVKAIPELMHCGLGFNPQIKSYGLYDMDFLRRDILPNVTTLMVPINIQLPDSVIEDWHRRGKRFIAEVYASSPEPKIPVCITYHWKVFRAKAATATLTVSDWPDPNRPTAPFGQEQAFNFLEIQPYHE